MRIFLFLAFLFLLSFRVYSQEEDGGGVSQKCENCSSNNVFKGKSIKQGNGNSHIIVVSSASEIWDNTLSPDDVVQFNYETGKEYEWLASNNEEVDISGIILEENVKLTIGRQSNDERPAFDIEGGCIVVKSGAVLNFAYYTKLKNVVICVEKGGSITFDSKASGGSTGERDDFVLEDIEISLDPEANIRFGNAEIVQLGRIVIEGYVGAGCTLQDNGSLTPPNSNIEVDLNRMSEEELRLFCNFLSEAGFSILPVEWYETSVSFDSQSRKVAVNWSTIKEWENSHFEVERSINGIQNWKKIGEVAGMGWSDELTEYCFEDEDLPLRGGRVYYRIRQVDFNGKFDFSPTKMVQVPGLQVTKGEWRGYPNPVSAERFQVVRLSHGELRGDIKVRVMSAQISLAAFSVSSEEALNEKLGKVVRGLARGVFVVEIQSNQQVEYLKVMKQ